MSDLFGNVIGIVIGVSLMFWFLRLVDTNHPARIEVAISSMAVMIAYQIGKFVQKRRDRWGELVDDVE